MRLVGGETLPVVQVFVYAGLVAANDLLLGLGADCTGARHGPRARRSAAANARGLFAAGTLRAGHDGQAASAIADGATAAEAAHRFLSAGADVPWPAPTETPHAERTPA
ncbi:MAG: hypothetical protein U1F25_16040 [Rubrivivax sp.]